MTIVGHENIKWIVSESWLVVCHILQGFREKLHGHNYRLAVTITGQVGPDGYVVDFGEIKKISRVICKDLNESFLVPMNSDALKVKSCACLFA